ncbi:MAG: mannose-6-phosphate isomerase, class I, partial [Geodermatophilaceae bacterium]|nr:mannose-6-phosphate isomerase, class I [Geodermatophilaceae bacterium]
MLALINEIRRYAWGSQTAMAEFLGRKAPTAEPEAELWIGAYPACPSRLADGRTLQELIAADPTAALGAAAVARFGPRLPFLLKVLTIGAPLSLQAHPDAGRAEQGFAAEEAAGVPLDHPSRNYRDPRHKPEMLCALTPVEAFCGFRAVPETVALLDELAVAELAGLRDTLSVGGLPDAVRWIFDVPNAEVEGAVSAVGKAASKVGSGPDVPALQWISRLADKYPDDRGVLLTLLCGFIRLEPGEALVVPAGCLHAYLAGVGVEIMAESDNVLRGG